MDNRKINIISGGKDGLMLALRLIWPNAPGGKATHYTVKKLSYKTEYFIDKTKNLPTIIPL